MEVDGDADLCFALSLFGLLRGEDCCCCNGELSSSSSSSISSLSSSSRSLSKSSPPEARRAPYRRTLRRFKPRNEDSYWILPTETPTSLCR